jgi:hypothetical protein
MRSTASRLDTENAIRFSFETWPTLAVIAKYVVAGGRSGVAQTFQSSP